jgi:hypothetical protein
MMKCVCRTQCQTRLDGGKIKFFNVGDVGEFEKCPTHFESLEKVEEVSFQTASKDELLEAKWKRADAVDFIKEKGGEPKVTSKTTKTQIVDQILDARFREVD